MFSFIFFSPDVCSKKLIELYRLAMAGVFTGYFDSWKILTNQMLDTGEVTKTEIIKLQSEYVIPVLDETCIKYDYTLHEMQVIFCSIHKYFYFKKHQTSGTLEISASRIQFEVTARVWIFEVYFVSLGKLLQKPTEGEGYRTSRRRLDYSEQR